MSSHPSSACPPSKTWATAASRACLAARPPAISQSQVLLPLAVNIIYVIRNVLHVNVGTNISVSQSTMVSKDQPDSDVVYGAGHEVSCPPLVPVNYYRNPCAIALCYHVFARHALLP